MLISIAAFTLLFSAFFSGVEIAFISANKLKLELDKNSGKFPANIITYFSKNESDFITTMLVGNNTALVVYGIVMTQILTPKIADYLHSDAALLLVQTIITTLIVLVTAEFLPKAIFRIYPNQILRVFSVPIWLFFVLFRPVALLMLYLSKVLLKHILGQKIEEGKQIFGKTDLDEYLSNVKSAEGDEENRVEVEMLQNVLDLTDKKLRECMIPRTEIVAMDIMVPIKEIKDKFIVTKLSKILIYKGNIDKVIGYVHSFDLFRNPINVRSILLPIPFVPESMSAMQLLNQFIESDAGLFGIQTQNDIIDYYYIEVTNVTSVLDKIENYTFELKNVYPNPVNNQAKIQFITGNKSDVIFTVFNHLGEKIEERKIAASRGINDIEISANDYANGMYLYSINNGTQIVSKRMIVAN